MGVRVYGQACACVFTCMGACVHWHPCAWWVSVSMGAPVRGCLCAWAVIRVNVHISWFHCLGGSLGTCVGTRAMQIWDTDAQEGEGTGHSPCLLRPLQGRVGGCEWGLLLPGDLSRK